jgi:hypothetical protein
MKRRFAHTVASFFGFFCVLFIPFSFNITTVQVSITDFIFGKLIATTSSAVFGKTLSDTRVYSDTVSMYILVLLLLIFAILVSLLLLQIKNWELYKGRVIRFFYCFFFYYLALQLLKYGADKIFKNQFYLPEPNILYTPLGRVDKDLLYWSSMGTSHFYNVFLGCLEMLAAIFILIKRTRLVGLLISLAVLLNVVAVNFGFDISVKLYSLFLFFLTVYLLVPYWTGLYQLFSVKPVSLNPVSETIVIKKKLFLSAFLKWLAIGLICLEVFYPFIKSGNFNGDSTKKPYLHGAYEIKQMIAGTDTLAADKLPLKRFFIHKDSYMIFQDQEDGMQDYKLSYDKAKNIYVLTDYEFKQTVISLNYLSTDSILTIKYSRDDKDQEIIGKSVDWRNLPLLKKSFHWTVDGR